MYARNLSTDNIGQDITITVGGIPTGGIIHTVGKAFGMVSINIDGTYFTVDGDKPVVVVEPSMRQMLNISSPATRRR
jgi:hypothetical protein